MFKLYDEDTSDLFFFLRDEGEEDLDEPGSRFELRRKYWSYALPIIQQEHGSECPFSNMNPSRFNSINGFFGLGGFYLCCVANYDSARAEIKLNRSKEENKSVYDSIYAHKAEIEDKLKTTLIWDRGEDKKSSKIYVQLNNVSI